MAEITSEMIDSIIEDEKKRKIMIEKKVRSYIYMLVPFLVIEAVLIIAFLFISIPKALLAIAGSIIADILYFIIMIEIFTAQEMKMQSSAVVSLYKASKRNRFAAIIDAAPTAEEKLRLYCENIKNTRNKNDKLSAVEEYLYFLNTMCIDEDINWIYEELTKIHSKKFITETGKLHGLLLYFSVKNDNEGFIRTLEENQDLIRRMWDRALFIKLDILVWCCEYYGIKEDYLKQLEYYDVMVEFRNKASEIDVQYVLTDEMLGEIKIDYARIYCRLGKYEEAEKCLREAEEKLANANIPYIKKFMDETRKMLEETYTDNTEGK